MTGEPLYSKLTLEARHEPDFTLEVGPNGEKESQELPGHVTFGVVVDGVFVPILRRKAAGLFADVKRAKKAAAETVGPPAPTPSEPPPPEPPAE